MRVPPSHVVNDIDIKSHLATSLLGSSTGSIFRILQKFFFHGLDNFLGILKCIVQTLRFGQTFGHTLTKNVLPTDQE